MNIKTDSGSVAKKLGRSAFLALFIYKITTLPYGRTNAISPVPQCLVLIFKRTQKDDGERQEVQAISIFQMPLKTRWKTCF